MATKNTKALSKSFKSKALLEKTVLTLEKENKALKDTVSKLLKEIDRLNEMDKTKSALTLNLSPEMEILEIQIHRLKAKSRERDLSLEESKMLDLYIKNKRLLGENEPLDANYSRVPDGVTDEDLLEIAGYVENEEETDEKTDGKRKSKASN